MHKKRIFFFILVIIAVCGAYVVLQSKQTIMLSPTKNCSFGEFKVRETRRTEFCGTDEVLDSNEKSIVMLSVCEDNICTIQKDDDWIEVKTTAGRSYKKNIKTGEEIFNAGGVVGGMSIVK